MLEPKYMMLPAISASVAAVSYTESAETVLPSHDLGRIYLNAKEEFTVQIGNRVFPVLHGDALYIPPFCECRTVKVISDAFGVFSLALSPALVHTFSPSLPLRHTVGRARYLFSYDTQAELFSLFTSLLQTANDADFCTVVRILSVLDKECLSKEEEIYEISLPILLRRALNYIDEHVSEAINADTLATRYGVSADTIKRLFRRFLSSTVREQHLRRRTIQTALLLSNQTELPLALSESGFLNKKAFSKAFLTVFNHPFR